MRISERYRLIYENVSSQLSSIQQMDDERLAGVLTAVRHSTEDLAEHLESVGEIPQIKLEQRLSPVLLQVHTKLDRARVLLESEGMNRVATNIWELEQQVYRLLNDL